jgi:hypothetical protein
MVARVTDRAVAQSRRVHLGSWVESVFKFNLLVVTVVQTVFKRLEQRLVPRANHQQCTEIFHVFIDRGIQQRFLGRKVIEECPAGNSDSRGNIRHRGRIKSVSLEERPCDKDYLVRR